MAKRKSIMADIPARDRGTEDPKKNCTERPNTEGDEKKTYTLKFLSGICRHETCDRYCQTDVGTTLKLKISNGIRALEKLTYIEDNQCLEEFFLKEKYQIFYWNTIGVRFDFRILKRKRNYGPPDAWTLFKKVWLHMAFGDVAQQIDAKEDDTIEIRGKLLGSEDDTVRDGQEYIESDEEEDKEHVNGTDMNNTDEKKKTLPINTEFKLLALNKARVITSVEQRSFPLKKNATFDDMIKHVMTNYYHHPLYYYSSQSSTDDVPCPFVEQNTKNKRQLLRVVFTERPNETSDMILVYYTSPCGEECKNCKDEFFKKK